MMERESGGAAVESAGYLLPAGKDSRTAAQVEHQFSLTGTKTSLGLTAEPVQEADPGSAWFRKSERFGLIKI